MTRAVTRLLRSHRALLIGAMVALFALASLYTLLGVGMSHSALDMTTMATMTDMPSNRLSGAWPASYALLVFLMWWVMMIAMMLPGVAPTILLYDALLGHVRRFAGHTIAPICFLAGYLLAWALFALLASALQWLLESQGSLSSGMMVLNGSVPGGILLVLAGLYQFTPLKTACLDHCRSPMEFLSSRNRPGLPGALMMGVEHGIYCLGCCWVLMALLFVGGIMNLYWIVALSTFSAVEKLAGTGERFSRLCGVALAGWGLWVLTGAYV